MTALDTEPALHVNRRSPGASRRAIPAAPAATESDTLATWSIPETEPVTTTASEPGNGSIRWYDPVTGRWLSKDPAGISFGLNQYEACANNPVNFTDPFGLWGIQFGSVNLGVGDPWMIFDNSSWMDISRGAAATLDGIIPFADPLTSAYADECGNVDSSYQWSRRLGGISRDALLSAAAIGWASRAGTASETLTVSRWGRPGLQPGDWVMRGPANRWNYLMSGKYQPSWMPGGNMPASFSSGQSFTVSGSSLQVPSGFFGPLKGALGQSMFVP